MTTQQQAPQQAAPQRTNAAEVASQAKQLASSAHSMAESVNKIVEWSRARLDRAVDAHEQPIDTVQGVAAKLIVHRASQVADEGELYLKQVDLIKDGMAHAHTLLNDVRKASHELEKLEGLLDAMENHQRV